MGLPIDAFTPEALVSYLLGESVAGRGGYVMTPNLDNLRMLKQDAELMELAMTADVRVVDGMPLLWASRIQGDRLPARLAGSDLILSLADAIARSGRNLFLLGGDPGTAEGSARALEARNPSLRIVGTYCPPHGFQDSASEMAMLFATLEGARPDFVYLGLPFPKAGALVAQIRDVLPTTWFLGLGISFSFVCDEISRAPKWMQQAGLEWLHRLAQEPRRLSRRYLVEGLPFATLLFMRSLLERRRSASS